MNYPFRQSEIEFQRTKSPSQDLLQAIRNLNIRHAFPPQTGEVPILTLDACLLLLQIQPLILYKREVIGGLRTYWLCKANVPGSQKVNVLTIGKKVDREDILKFAQNLYLLTTVANAAIKPGPTIYAAAIKNDQLGFASNYMTLFDSTQRTVASTLGMTVKTLTRKI